MKLVGAVQSFELVVQRQKGDWTVDSLAALGTEAYDFQTRQMDFLG